MPYQKSYKVSERDLEWIRNPGMSYADARGPYDGPLSSWIERSRFVRDGVQWVTLQERGEGGAVEIALDPSGDIAQVVALSPEQALALEPQSLTPL
jgi:hypothetical protein